MTMMKESAVNEAKNSGRHKKNPNKMPRDKKNTISEKGVTSIAIFNNRYQ